MAYLTLITKEIKVVQLISLLVLYVNCYVVEKVGSYGRSVIIYPSTVYLMKVFTTFPGQRVSPKVGKGQETHPNMSMKVYSLESCTLWSGSARVWIKSSQGCGPYMAAVSMRDAYFASVPALYCTPRPGSLWINAGVWGGSFFAQKVSGQQNIMQTGG